MASNAATTVCILLGILGRSSATDLASIRYRFTPCGAVGRRGPSLSQCETWYSQESSPVFTSRTLVGFQLEGTEVFPGSQGFRVPRSGVYNVTVAGAAGGRGICSPSQGKGLLWRGTVHLLDSQDLLVSVGQKGLEPCEIIKDIPLCANPPDSMNESRTCFEQWESWLFMHGLSEDAANITRYFGGGGAGGGASMLRVRDHETGQFNVLPVIVAGGGGGSAAVLSLSTLSKLSVSIPEEVSSNSSEDLYTHFINAKMAERDLSLMDFYNFSGVRGYIANPADLFRVRPGAGGGYFLAPSNPQDGSALNTSEEFALGGFDCLSMSTDLTQHLLLDAVHGGFGGGGGQCETGGSGGGYTGGSVFGNAYFGIPGNGGFYKYFSVPPNDAVQLSVRLNPELDGFVEIVPADCGCEYECIVDEEQQEFICECPENTTLAPNGLDCYEDKCIMDEEEEEFGCNCPENITLAPNCFEDCGRCMYKCIVDEELEEFRCHCPENATLAPNGFDCLMRNNERNTGNDNQNTRDVIIIAAALCGFIIVMTMAIILILTTLVYRKRHFKTPAAESVNNEHLYDQVYVLYNENADYGRKLQHQYERISLQEERMPNASHHANEQIASETTQFSSTADGFSKVETEDAANCSELSADEQDTEVSVMRIFDVTRNSKVYDYVYHEVPQVVYVERAQKSQRILVSDVDTARFSGHSNPYDYVHHEKRTLAHEQLQRSPQMVPVKRDQTHRVFYPNTAGFSGNAYLHERAQTHKQVLDLDTAKLLESHGYERAQTYEQVPTVDITGLLSEMHIYERAQTYERVPTVDIARLFSEMHIYERAQTYERVPIVDIARLLSEMHIYERAQTYERVPSVNIARLLSEMHIYERVQTYERVPTVSIASLLREASAYNL